MCPLSCTVLTKFLFRQVSFPKPCSTSLLPHYKKFITKDKANQSKCTERACSQMNILNWVLLKPFQARLTKWAPRNHSENYQFPMKQTKVRNFKIFHNLSCNFSQNSEILVEINVQRARGLTGNQSPSGSSRLREHKQAILQHR